MSKEAAFEHDYTDAIVCPHCGHRFMDSYGYDGPELECEQCGKAFILTIHNSISYSTKLLEGAK